MSWRSGSPRRRLPRSWAYRRPTSVASSRPENPRQKPQSAGTGCVIVEGCFHRSLGGILIWAYGAPARSGETHIGARSERSSQDSQRSFSPARSIHRVPSVETLREGRRSWVTMGRNWPGGWNHSGITCFSWPGAARWPAAQQAGPGRPGTADSDAGSRAARPVPRRQRRAAGRMAADAAGPRDS